LTRKSRVRKAKHTGSMHFIICITVYTTYNLDEYQENSLWTIL